jgi:hypothetical protein
MYCEPIVRLSARPVSPASTGGRVPLAVPVVPAVLPLPVVLPLRAVVPLLVDPLAEGFSGIDALFNTYCRADPPVVEVDASIHPVIATVWPAAAELLWVEGLDVWLPL